MLEPSQTLSVLLTELLAEAQALVDLKAKFGRLPDSPLRTAIQDEIDEWFDVVGEDTLDTVKLRLNQPESLPCVLIEQEVALLREFLLPDLRARADYVVRHRKDPLAKS